MSKTAFDQSYQSELAARAGWIAACQNYEGSLDSFKARIGLPPDARIRPRESDLEGLRALVAAFLASAEDDAGPADGAESLPAPDSVDEGALKAATDRALAVAFERRTDVLSARDLDEIGRAHV